MHWKYDWVEQLPQSVYAVLVAMLNREAKAAAEPDAVQEIAEELDATHRYVQG
jgi:hypothetical protein